MGRTLGTATLGRRPLRASVFPGAGHGCGGAGLCGSRWAGPLGDGEAAAAVPSAVPGRRGPETASRHRIFAASQVPCPPRWAGPGASGAPGASSRLSRAPSGFQLMVGKEGESELVLPLAQRPSAFLYCLLLLDMAAATSRPHICFQTPRGPGRELSPLGQSLNPDPYFLMMMASDLSRGLESGRG